MNHPRQSRSSCCPSKSCSSSPVTAKKHDHQFTGSREPAVVALHRPQEGGNTMQTAVQEARATVGELRKPAELGWRQRQRQQAARAHAHSDRASSRPIPNQVRQTWDTSKDESGKTALDRLADSIRNQGLLSELVVTPQGDRYLIVCGERRYRAIKNNNLMKEVPCIVREEPHARADAGTEPRREPPARGPHAHGRGQRLQGAAWRSAAIRTSARTSSASRSAMRRPPLQPRSCAQLSQSRNTTANGS